jgi:hypothetical protein
MYFEKLALEVNAAAAGLEIVRPAVLRGRSGMDQRFTFVAKDEGGTYAFDLYTEVTEKEVLRTYMKKLDTGAEAHIICLKGRPTVEASELASYYSLGLMGPGKVEDFFRTKVSPRVAAPEPIRARA